MNSNNDHDPNEDRVPNGAGAHGKGKEEDIGEDDVFHRMLMTDEDVHERTRGSGVARDAQSVASENAQMMTLLKQLVNSAAPRADSRVDGEHSDSPGAGPCGRKHWYEGREVDIVSKFMSRMIGFNITDNPLLVAQAFVAKHNLNPTSTDNTALITKIADSIREMCNESRAKQEGHGGGAAGEPLDLEDQINRAASVNPYMDEPEVPTVIRPHSGPGNITAVYNRQTKQVDVYHYPSDVEAESIKRREEEAKKEAKKRALLQRESETKLEEARRLVAMNKQDKKHDKPVSYVVQPKNPASPSGGMATLSKLPAGGGAATGGGGGGALGGGVVSGGALGGGGAVGGGGSKRKSSGGKDGLRPKAKWDNGYAVSRFRKVGETQFMRDMDEQGFTLDEQILVMTKMPTLLQMARDDFDEDDEADLAEDKFAGPGHSLLDNGNNNNNNNNNGEMDEGAGTAGTEEEPDVAEVVVDKSQPFTQLRVAIPDRGALTGEFNLTHTVQDIRRYINRHSPVARGYHLQTLRPPRRLTEPTETIAQAKLQMSSIQLILM